MPALIIRAENKRKKKNNKNKVNLVLCIHNNDSDYTDFSARLAGLKILACFENTGLGFLARYFQTGL